MDAITAIKTRRSIRAYQSRPVPRDVLADIVDCARQAPTAMNQQVWDFVVVTQPPTLAKLYAAIGHAKFLDGLPAGIALLSKEANYFVEDASAATTNILLAARAHGLGSCWVAGHGQPYADAVRDLLGAPSDRTFFAFVSLGYPAEEPTVEKRPLDDVLHWEKW